MWRMYIVYRGHVYLIYSCLFSIYDVLQKSTFESHIVIVVVVIIIIVVAI